jgi:hypothetical protein
MATITQHIKERRIAWVDQGPVIKKSQTFHERNFGTGFIFIFSFSFSFNNKPM